MCGIAGLIGALEPLDRERITSMTGSLEHRGPDEEGVTGSVADGYLLGHRRLSILGLGPEGAQPIRSLDGKIELVFNGEIYNHRALANRYSIKIEGQSDTAVLCELLSKQGVSVLKEVQGMFALAFVERETGTCVLARDHVGIKPLFWSTQEGRLIFASEMRAMCRAGVKMEYDIPAVAKYLRLGYFSGENTVSQRIKKLAPGSFLTWKKGGFKLSSYLQKGWPDSRLGQNIENPEREFIDRFSKATEARLLSERPTGVFLSGGTDSSLVAAFSQRAQSEKLKTYSIRVEDAVFDESTYAERVAQELGTEHLTIPLKQSDIKDSVLGIINHLDEPFGDSSFIPFSVLSEVTSPHITVALSGDGADELFQGYGSYNWAARLQSIPRLFHPSISRLLKVFRPNPHKPHYRYFQGSKTGRFLNLASTELDGLSQELLEDLLIGGHQFTHHFQPREAQASMSDREIMADLDYHSYLPHDLLVKVDRASMRSSQEVRVPFLDRSVIELAYQLPLKEKFHKGETKVLLKKVLAKYISHDLVYRKKWGFSIPLHAWLAGDLDYLVQNLEEDCRNHPISFIDSHVVLEIIRQFRNGRSEHYQALWLLIQLYRWHKQSGIS